MENLEIMRNGAFVSLFALIIAFSITTLLGPVFIPWLHKLKFGQEIRDEGPKWHQKKSGTPTMGGVMFIAGIGIAILADFIITKIRGNSTAVELKGLLMYVIALGFGVIGFIDDYIKVVKKRNLGLTAIQKLGLQILMAVVYIGALIAMGEFNTDIIIPFTKIAWHMPMWLYVPFVLIVILGTVNAVNLTDGLDGLATSITIIVGIFFAGCALLEGQFGCMSFAVSMVGGLLGFLLFNKYPAKVFMGDTGSLFLGAAVVVMAVGMQMPLFILIAGFVYFAETLSVMLQTAYFKYTKKKYGEGKRIFKMSPLHHHFEMSGWNEKKIVGIFSLVTLVLCVIAFFAFKIYI